MKKVPYNKKNPRTAAILSDSTWGQSTTEAIHFDGKGDGAELLEAVEMPTATARA